MITKPFKLFISKDVARDTDIVGGITLAAMINTAGSTPLQDGDVVILDKNMKVLTPGSTVADTDTIYVAMGHSVTYTVVNEAGTSIAARKIKLSDPIKANYIKKYSGKVHAAKAEQAWTATFTATTVGRQYVLRIVYKDLYEHPGLYTQTYNYTATATDQDTMGAALVALVNGDSNCRVTAAYTAGSDAFVLTAKAIPGCTTGLSDIDEFHMVSFEPYINYVDSNNNQQEFVDFTIATNLSTGTGTWELMRDLEKEAWAYEGVHNRTQFPVTVPDFRTVKSSNYNLLIIEHDIPYKTPNNLYSETTQAKTIIAFIDGTNGDAQQAFVLSQLNPWMASTPAGFANVTSM